MHQNPDVKALVWFNAIRPTEGNNWLVESSQQEMDAFRRLAQDSYWS